MGTEAILADDFVYTVNNVDHVTHVSLTSAGIVISDGKEVHSYRLKYIHMCDVIGNLYLILDIISAVWCIGLALCQQILRSLVPTSAVQLYLLLSKI